MGWANDRGVDFDTVIGPVLAAKCGHCHSDQTQKGGLDLSSLSGIRAGGESGETLVSDSIEESWLWNVIADGEMPPDGEPPLSDRERTLIRRWLESDAARQLVNSHRPITQHDVLPIVLLRCTTCHGPRRQDGNLDLRTRESMLKGGESGPAIVPGDADASLMIQRIESDACPPTELLLKFFVRRPTSSEVDVLRNWIAGGAKEFDIKPDVADGTADPLVSDSDRQHWAYQSVRKPTTGDSIDEFIRQRLAAAGLTQSPIADRDTLIRRVYIDLIGMPPSIEQWHRWRESDEPDWYARMVDHVLASPHYGERWGRYWLDLAGYADSEGGISADPIRPVAWKYRDYVIASFNEDKPYDQFLRQQIAGDELIDYASASNISDELVENLIATGFLRMGIDETGSRTMNFVPERLKVIGDVINIVSSSLMGLTMECARCHSHKYDPIPQRDYYRFKAIFQGALDEHDWSSFKTRKLSVATKEHRQQIAAVNPPLEKELKRLLAQERKLKSELQLALLRHHYPDQSVDDNRATLKALRKADNNRSLKQKILVEKLQIADTRSDEQQSDQILSMRQEIVAAKFEAQKVRRKMVPPPTIRALWDFGRPSPTYILRRGEHDKPGRLVGPGVPSVLTDGKTPLETPPPFPSGTSKTGRRLALVRWMTSPKHPLTARVMVNRIWYHHFGAGLVRELENFGVQAESPSHPALLDWLALEFINNGWSIKAMHRLIMNSHTYRQTSSVSNDRQERDPQNRLLSRMSLRRLDAEALRDSILHVAGKLAVTPGGIPDAVTVDRDGLVSVYPTEDGLWRRSVYLQYRRTEIPTMMDTFDYPQMGPNCVARTVSTVSPQSLMLMNNRHVRRLAGSFAQRIVDSVGHDDAATKVDQAYCMAISRLPTNAERRLGIQAIERLEKEWHGDRQKALETYCHTILNSASFLYVD